MQTYANKIAAARFLKKAETGSNTDPVPALKTAFKMLRALPDSAKGKDQNIGIVMLTDGRFEEPDEVLRQIKEGNPNRKYMISTMLFDCDDDTADEIMEKIADENKGTFRNIKPE